MNQPIVDSWCGQIEYFPYRSIPSGWVRCDGSVWSGSDYMGAMTLLGTRFGPGTGRNSFRVPDLVNAPTTPVGTVAAICLGGTYPNPYSTSDVAAFIGQVLYVAHDTVPFGWAKCDGSLLPVQDNTALFTLIGTHHGGTADRFALPNLMHDPAVPAGVTPIICLQGEMPRPDAWPDLIAYIGQIILTSFDFAPPQLHVCDGSMLDWSTNTILGYVLDGRFGGTVSHSVGLPKLVNAATTPKGLTPCMHLSGMYPTVG